MDGKDNKEKKFRVYHGDTPQDILKRVQAVLATYGLGIVENERGDFYVEHEIKALK